MKTWQEKQYAPVGVEVTALMTDGSILAGITREIDGIWWWWNGSCFDDCMIDKWCPPPDCYQKPRN